MSSAADGSDAADAALLAEVGAAIAAARTSAGFSQSALATAAGVNRSFLHAVEKGTSKPTIIILVRIARALDTTVAVMLRDIT